MTPRNEVIAFESSKIVAAVGVGSILGRGVWGGTTGGAHGAHGTDLVPGVGAGRGGTGAGLLDHAGTPKSAGIVSFDPTSPSAPYFEFCIVF